jgi:hypothetical protein
MRRRAAALLCASAIALAPRLALACPYCAGNADGSRTGYLWATALMLLLPALLGAGFVFWMRREYRS